MKIKSLVQKSIMIVITSYSLACFANHSSLQNTEPHKAQDVIQQHEKDFNFDWNNFATIAPGKAKIGKTEAFLNTITDYSHLNKADRQALGKLYYKLGTYYTHVTRESDLAIFKMNLADAFLKEKQDKAWNYNHLAYAYEQKFAASGKTSDKENALEYVNKVIAGLYSNAKNKETAFAYCVKGLVLNDAKNYLLAELSFRLALKMYESLPDGKDDQYARAKNRLANIILDQNGRDKEALVMLEQLKQYWLAKGNIGQDPYAARNFISLGQAYLKTGQKQAARNELNHAVAIYKNVYGEDSTLLAKPYQLLAEA
jgi:hypothetical protein